MSKPLCVHCGWRVSKARRLCEPCHRDKAIRAQYPRKDNYDEPTQEEVDALIAKWLPTMPSNDEEPPGEYIESEATEGNPKNYQCRIRVIRQSKRRKGYGYML